MSTRTDASSFHAVLRRLRGRWRASRPLALSAVAGLLATALPACGDLDDVTTVKDLRVLAIRAEPAGFLVDVDNPGTGMNPDWQATLTALVVDPTGVGQTVEMKALGCPDYLDTITAATGTATRTCPSTPPDVPEPLKANLTSREPVGSPAVVAPTPADGFTYLPPVQFGLTTDQLGYFFQPPNTGVPIIDNALTNNRTFGLDAITSFTFTRGTQSVEVIKRVVYWPRLDPSLYPGQTPNKNPEIPGITFFGARNDTTGDPELPLVGTPELSIARGDKLFVLPAKIFADGSREDSEAEDYVFYQKDHEMNGAIVATKAKEYLRYTFFATAGTFSPAERDSELSPFFTSKDGRVHLDSEYTLPKLADLPADNNVTIWVVVRDERAGVGWSSKTIRVVP